MSGIIANAWRLPAAPDEEEIDQHMQAFSLRHQGLLSGNTCAPMLVINGEQDQYIPQQDSMLFARYPDNHVWFMRGMTHCAAEGIVRIMPAVIAWLRLHLYGQTITSRLLFRLAERFLPQRLDLKCPMGGRKQS